MPRSPRARGHVLVVFARECAALCCACAVFAGQFKDPAVRRSAAALATAGARWPCSAISVLSASCRPAQRSSPPA
eukprot:4901070-Alexandrium_andersonii.AAC.1